MKTKQLSPKAIALLHKVQARFRRNPKRFDQHEGSYDSVRGCCICAHMEDLAKVGNVFRRNARELHLTAEQWELLFVYGAWPMQFKRSTNPTAQTAIKRIDHFIATDGRE